MWSKFEPQTGGYTVQTPGSESLYVDVGVLLENSSKYFHMLTITFGLGIQFRVFEEQVEESLEKNRKIAKDRHTCRASRRSVHFFDSKLVW